MIALSTIRAGSSLIALWAADALRADRTSVALITLRSINAIRPGITLIALCTLWPRIPDAGALWTLSAVRARRSIGAARSRSSIAAAATTARYKRPDRRRYKKRNDFDDILRLKNAVGIDDTPVGHLDRTVFKAMSQGNLPWADVSRRIQKVPGEETSD